MTIRPKSVETLIAEDLARMPDPDPVIVEIWFAGDLITPDDSDTDCYGDPCLPGYGYTLDSGWVDPDWSLWEIWDNREDVRPDEILLSDLLDWIDDTGQDLEALILDRVTDRLGPLDSQDGDSYYSADEIQNYITGQTQILSAHISRRYDR